MRTTARSSWKAAPDAGTTFRVFFPCSAACKQTAPQEWTADHRGSGTILIVDDEDIVLRMAESVLDEAGYEVLSASNGSEALDCMRRSPAGSTPSCWI